jgi:hypothetical protein
MESLLVVVGPPEPSVAVEIAKVVGTDEVVKAPGKGCQSSLSILGGSILPSAVDEASEGIGDTVLYFNVHEVLLLDR